VPHFIVEYSDNLEAAVDMGSVLDAVHAAAMATGFVALDALRVRAEPRSLYRIADGHPDNAFLGVIARMAPGRTDEQKQLVLESVLDAVETSLGAAAANVMLSVEYQEIDARYRINKNNLRDAIAARGTGTG
jgi:5-carboxymethyl-2-hydroxymuconate isomerase